MADIQTTHEAGKKHADSKRAKRLSTKVDLTPMVDLGFLLITFFIFTTSLSKPTAMNLVIPTEGNHTQVAESKTLNLVLAADNKVRYYVGNEVWNQGCTDFSTNGIRDVLLFMQKSVAKRFGNKAETVILIHPTSASSYSNLVDCLDEILIAGIKKYALMGEPDNKILATKNLKAPC